MRVAFMLVLMAAVAEAHPHPGGIVVLPDGTIVVGDMLGSRMVTFAGGEPRVDGRIGHVRELEISGGVVWGVSVGQGLWRLDGDGFVRVLPEFHGLFARGPGSVLYLAPADSLDRRPRLLRDGKPLAELEQIEALAHDGERLWVVDGEAVRTVGDDGAVTTVAERVGRTPLGMALVPGGAVVAVFGDRRVVEVGARRRVRFESTPPWGPVDVAVRGAELFVVEYAEECCWKGPRVWRVPAAGAPELVGSFESGCGVLDLLTCRERPAAPARKDRSPWLGVAIAGGVAVLIGGAIALRR
jgi:hypothetical protein